MELTNIRPFSSKETALHGLINNAGIMGVPFSRTKDGYEIQFQVLSTLNVIYTCPVVVVKLMVFNLHRQITSPTGSSPIFFCRYCNRQLCHSQEPRVS